MMQAIVQEKACNFASLRQLVLYVLQFWGVARFIEVQDMQIGHLVRRVNHFELTIFRSKAGAPKSREIIPIYPTPARYANTFCPVSILSNYCKARQELCTVLDSDYLFPKMSSSFEQGTEQHLLTVATPQKCLPADSFRKKFRSHVDFKELKAVGVNPIDYTSDSFKLGGQ